MPLRVSAAAAQRGREHVARSDEEALAEFALLCGRLARKSEAAAG